MAIIPWRLAQNATPQLRDPQFVDTIREFPPGAAEKGSAARVSRLSHMPKSNVNREPARSRLMC
jgi:hypothetical protein